MKLNWFRSRSAWALDTHEAWLAAQARKGLRYRGRIVTLDQFEPGEAGEFVFCWDRAPLFGKKARADYIRSREEAGWQAAAESGGMICWRRPHIAGQPVPALRDAKQTRQMFACCANDNLLLAFPVLLLTLHAAVKLRGDDLGFAAGNVAAVTLGTLALALSALNILRLRRLLLP